MSEGDVANKQCFVVVRHPFYLRIRPKLIHRLPSLPLSLGGRLLSEDVWLHEFRQAEACGTRSSLGCALFVKECMTTQAQHYPPLLFIKDVRDEGLKALPAAIVTMPCEAAHLSLLKRKHGFEPNAFDGRVSLQAAHSSD